jgi:hypothetical protein
VTRTRIILFVIGALAAILEALRVALEDGQALTLHTALAVGGAAVAGYVLKYRADLTPKEAAKQLAAARADTAAAVRASYLPPPPHAPHRYTADAELLDEVTPPRRRV